MALPRLLRTSSFRLTLLYAGLFGASVLILFGVIYWATDIYMTSSLDADIDSDLAELEDTFRTGGISSLAALIGERVRQSPNGPMHYLLGKADRQIIAGNLPASASSEGRFDLSLPSPDPHHDHRLSLRGRDLELSGGAHLILAVDAQPRTEMHELILRAFGWSSAITLVLAFGGGAVISGSLLRRIETIARTARDIMAGDFSRRIPIRGTDDEFDHLVVSLNAMLDQIETSLESLRHVSNDIAHDLRTPLTRARLALERGRTNATTLEQLQSVADKAITGIDQSLAIITALLRLAEIENSRRSSGFGNVPLHELLREVGDIYEPIAENKNIVLQVQATQRLHLRGDRDLLIEAVANLVDNAIKFTPEGGKVDIELLRVKNQTIVRVADTGCGISEQDREAVLRRFYRSDKIRNTPGVGLGLNLVAAIVKLHGFRLAIHSGPAGCVEIICPDQDDSIA